MIDSNVDTEAGMNRAQRRARRRKGAALAAGSAALVAGGVPMLAVAPAGADDIITVTTLDDSGAGSLREAITTANGDADHDTIVFSVSGTITLASDLPTIDNFSATIDGTGITIDAAGFEAIRFDDMDSDTTAAIIGLTVENGDANQGGGIAIDAENYGDPMASATLTGVTLLNNSASGNGGGLYLNGAENISIIDSTFEGNDTSGGDGGAVYIGNSVTVNISGSSFVGNYAESDGGALSINVNNGLLTGKDVSIVTSSFISNQSSGGGGGLMFGSGGAESVQTLEILNSTVSYNTNDAYGGGLYLGYYWETAIANSTITGNSSTNDGGGIYGSAGGLVILSSTIAANTTEGDGAGIATSGDGTVLAGEVSPAQITPPGFVYIFGSIIAGNTGSDDIGIYDGTPVIQAEQSLIGTVTEGLNFTAGEGTQVGVDPAALLLGELDDNGGPTPTHALGEGSIAIDASGAEIPEFPGSAYDQRGEGYDRIVNGALDTGAYEVQVPGPSPDPVTPSFTG